MESRGRTTEQFVIDQIRRLNRQGFSVREIARISGKSTNTVLKYKDYQPPGAAPAAPPAPAPPPAASRRKPLGPPPNPPKGNRPPGAG